MARNPDGRFASVADLRAALLGVELGDDALPMVDAEDTPPGGVPLSFRQTERSWLVPAAGRVSRRPGGQREVVVERLPVDR